MGRLVFREVLKNAKYIPPVIRSKIPMATGIQIFVALPVGMVCAAIGIRAGFTGLAGLAIGLV